MTRNDYRSEVERLLEQIQDGTSELRRLHVHGVTRAALADRKRELRLARQRLAELVSGEGLRAAA